MMRILNILIALSLVSTAKADVVLDGSLGGTPGATVPSGVGATFLITEDLGTASGSNIFYSFETFDLEVNDSALFTGQSSFDNLVARVTGGSQSSISGSITSDYAGANLWLLNSSGVVFNAGSSINVDGSFYVSSADSILFDDGEVLNFDSAPPAALSVGDPVSFGFLDTNTSQVAVNGTTLTITAAESIGVVSNDILIDGLTFDTNNEHSFKLLSAATDGSVDIASTGTFNPISGSEIEILNSDIELALSSTNSAFIAADTVNINNSELTFKSSVVDENPLFKIAAGNISVIEGSTITLTTAGAGSLGVSGELIASEDILVQGADDGTRSRISATAGLFDAGTTAGDLVVTAENIRLLNDGSLSSSLFDATSASGRITLNAADEIEINNGAITAIPLGSSGGGVEITAQQLSVSGEDGRIENDNFGSGSSAPLIIDVADLVVTESGKITSENETGPSGGIQISSETVRVTDDGLISTLAFGAFDGGDVELVTDVLTVESGGQISAGAMGAGTGGEVNVDARLRVEIDGQNLESDTGLFARTGIDLEDIRGGLPEYGDGDGGQVVVNTSSISIVNGGQISSEAGRAGDAGDIFLTADRLDILSGSSIQTSAAASSGGGIDIRVVDFIGIRESGILTDSRGALPENPGGDIFIDPELLFFQNAQINANANGGNGGNIQIIANNIIQDPSTQITASSNLGIDGDITIDGIVNEVTATELADVSFADVTKLLSQKCTSAQLAERSSFVVSGNAPERPAPARYDLSEREIGVVFEPDASELIASYHFNHCWK